MNRVAAGLLLALVIAALIGLAEWLGRRFAVESHYTRKFVHIATGLLTLTAPLFFSSREPVLAITGFFLLLLPFAIYFRWFPGIHDVEGGPYGTFFFGVAFFLLVLLCWEESRRPALYGGMMVLTWGDALAGLVGRPFGRRRFPIGRSAKSLEGTGAMLVGSFVASAITLGLYGFAPFTELLGIALLVAVIATAVEMVTPGGLDNLTVPISAAFVIHLLATGTPAENAAFAIGAGLSLGFALLALAANLLQFTGAVTSVILGSIVFGIGGWAWAVPILIFFFSSSLIGLFTKESKIGLEGIWQKRGPRDYVQALANGGIAAAIVLVYYFFEDIRLYYVYLGTLAAVNADTWSTEIGILSKSIPKSAASWRPVPRGLSGGVTALGFAGALIGSLAIVLSGLFFEGRFAIGPSLFVVILLAGFFGSYIDSLLGSTIQGVFRCPSCHHLTEQRLHCGEVETVLHSGSARVSNDFVNMLCGFSGAVFVAFSLTFF